VVKILKDGASLKADELKTKMMEFKCQAPWERNVKNTNSCEDAIKLLKWF